MSKKKKRKTRKAKNLVGLRKNAYRYHTKNYVDSIDDGYLEKLDPKEKKWMNKFLREYYGTTFSSSRPLHGQGKTIKRELYREKNKREADMTYRRNKVTSKDVAEFLRLKSTESNPEDAILEMLDIKRGIGKLAEDATKDEDPKA